MRITSTSFMRGMPKFGHERSIHLLLVLKVRQPCTGRFAAQLSIFEPTPQHEASVAWFTNRFQIVQPRSNVKAKVRSCRVVLQAGHLHPAAPMTEPLRVDLRLPSAIPAGWISDPAQGTGANAMVACSAYSQLQPDPPSGMSSSPPLGIMLIQQPGRVTRTTFLALPFSFRSKSAG